MNYENKATDLFNVFFKDKHLYKYLTDENKEYMFFIFNRNFSKEFPEKAQLLNSKIINKVSAIDTWFAFYYNKPFPYWFWKKQAKESEKSDFSENDIKLLISKLNIKKEEFNFLLKYYLKELKEEFKYYKSLEKNN